jgi:imidazolonepropionase-like amidohydrolase
MNARVRVAVVLSALACPGAGAETIALVGGRVFPVASPALENGTVLMRDGKLVAVGKDVSVPADARVIDVRGQHVYPGLIDGLTQIGLTEIASVPGSVDITEVGEINPQGQAWLAVNPHSEHLAVARANGLTAVVSAPEGRLLSGRSALLRLAGDTPQALAVRPLLALHMTFPSGRPAAGPGRAEESDPKTFEDRQQERKDNRARELRRLAQLLADARAYASAGPQAATDVVLAALAPAAQGRQTVVMRADTEEDIRAAVEFGKAQGLKLVLAGALEAWRCAALLAEHDVPVLLKINRLPRRENDPYDAAYANAAHLHAAGVRLAIVSSDAAFARNLPYEAAMARAFGLPADVALQAITLAPARILGFDDRKGSLEPGKDADVIVTSGDVLDVRSRVTHVFIDGLERSLASRHTRLHEAFRERRGPVVP